MVLDYQHNGLLAGPFLLVVPDGSVEDLLLEDKGDFTAAEGSICCLDGDCACPGPAPYFLECSKS